MPINRWTNEPDIVYPYSQWLLSSKEEQATDMCDMNEPHYAEWKKPDIKVVVYDFIYVKF